MATGQVPAAFAEPERRDAPDEHPPPALPGQELEAGIVIAALRGNHFDLMPLRRQIGGQLSGVLRRGHHVRIKRLVENQDAHGVNVFGTIDGVSQASAWGQIFG